MNVRKLNAVSLKKHRGRTSGSAGESGFGEIWVTSEVERGQNLIQ